MNALKERLAPLIWRWWPLFAALPGFLFLTLDAFDAFARPGGGHSYSGGGHSSGGSRGGGGFRGGGGSFSGGGGGDSDAAGLLIWLLIRHPHVGVPLILIVVAIVI